MNKNKSWIEVSKSSLCSNLSSIRRQVGDKVKILAIVKSNAYGHGLKQVSFLLEDKTDWFGVDSIEEAMEIRLLGCKKPIVVLGYISPERLVDASSNNISVSFYNEDFFKKMDKLPFDKPLKIHIKIETGMNRQGVSLNNLESFIDKLKSSKNEIFVEGVYTHFSDTQDLKFVDLQFNNFKKAIRIIEKNGFISLIKHSSASAGMLIDKKYHLDMVRAGISLYGYMPYSKPESGLVNLDLSPVLGWKSIVAQIKLIEAGQYVGYGRTWQSKIRTKIAIIPVGYYDGFDREFSNNGRVLIKGKTASIIGRIAMNMFTIDISGIKNVEVGDEVILIGKHKNNFIDVNELAERIGTINHEILARINPQIPRVVV